MICAWWTEGNHWLPLLVQAVVQPVKTGSFLLHAPSTVYSKDPKMTLSLASKRLFYFIPPSLMSSDVWALPQNIGRPQQTWVTHRACKFNCISLKTGRENMLWTRTYFKVIPKYHSDCICTWNKERCRGVQAGLNRMHSSAVPELSSSEPPWPYSVTGKKRCCHVSIPWQSPHNRVVFKASRINQSSLTVVLTFAGYISHDVWG